MIALVENKKKVARLMAKDLVNNDLIPPQLQSDIQALYFLLTQDDDFLEMNERNYQLYLDILERE